MSSLAFTRSTGFSTQLLVEGVLCPIIHVSLMKILKNINPWVITLVISLQLGLMTLIATLQTWQFCQFLFHLTVLLYSPYFTSFVYEVVTEDSVKSLIQVKLNDIHCSPLIYQSNIVVYQMCQTLSPMDS